MKRRAKARKERQIEKQRQKLIDEYNAIDWNCENIKGKNIQKYKKDLRKADPKTFGYMYENLEKYERECEQFEKDKKEQEKKAMEQRLMNEEAAKRKKKLDEDRAKLLDDYERVKGLPCSQIDSADVQTYVEDVGKADQAIFGSFKTEVDTWVENCKKENEEKLKTNELVAKDVCHFQAKGEGTMAWLSTGNLGAVFQSANRVANNRLEIDIRMGGVRKRIIQVTSVDQIEQPAKLGEMQIVTFASDDYDIQFAQEVEVSKLLTWSDKKVELRGGEATTEESVVDTGSFIWSMTGGAKIDNSSFSGDLIHLDEIHSSASSSLPEINVDLESLHETKLHTSFW